MVNMSLRILSKPNEDRLSWIFKVRSTATVAQRAQRAGSTATMAQRAKRQAGVAGATAACLPVPIIPWACARWCPGAGHLEQWSGAFVLGVGAVARSLLGWFGARAVCCGIRSTLEAQRPASSPGQAGPRPPPLRLLPQRRCDRSTCWPWPHSQQRRTSARHHLHTSAQQHELPWNATWACKSGKSGKSGLQIAGWL